ncbi:aquaporin-like protein [Zopfochytrium polystomum]|nr:aquaporin-like protein [Zopfochytrium polystomum]
MMPAPVGDVKTSGSMPRSTTPTKQQHHQPQRQQRPLAVTLALQSLAEFYGMFVFIFLSLAGVQSAVFQGPAPTALLQISLVFGLALTTAVWLTFRISGGALNPAVNLGLLVAGAMDPVKAVAYTFAQCAGAVAACAAVAAVIPGSHGKAFFGANAVQAASDGSAACSPAQAFVLEAVLTMGLVLVVLFMAVDKHRATFMAPLMIGLYVFIAHLISIPYTNTSINPARSLGASVVSGTWNDHWIFWAGPFTGAVVAGLIHRFYKAVDYESLNPGQDADEAEMV